LGLRAIALRKATGLNLLPTVARLVQWQSCPGSILKL